MHTGAKLKTEGSLMKFPSSKSAPEKSINLKRDAKPFSNKTPFSPMKMIISPSNFLKEDTKSKKSDQTPFKSNNVTLSSPLNLEKLTEASKFKLNSSKKKGLKVLSFTKLTSKNFS